MDGYTDEWVETKLCGKIDGGKDGLMGGWMVG